MCVWKCMAVYQVAEVFQSEQKRWTDLQTDIKMHTMQVLVPA